ncbi:plasmid pRiA4b ORF-3 family protein [Sporosarcina sp. E16_3]|uniref:plasmid pRiA4b ORF-3 family protein n=1 Tax=Sporosarcina sp. E16_3 TaxID=2789293 RepID=UPI001A933645|nr:plasmid pRiA4b ORF-3 family protein [Sporosarcina sp. E16_3]MBO0600925.1 plasmid pRiA4b ORF-3 family protein [Sporosarcina sp. E16_3]
MHIRCTKKLLVELKVEPESVSEDNPLFSWHANLIMVNRRKAIVLMNDHNRYAVVLYGLKAKDFNRFTEIALQGIRETFQAEGISDKVIDRYLLHTGEVSMAKTKDRTSVARMNKACDNAYFFDELWDNDSIFQPAMGLRISRLLAGGGNKSYIYPNEEMYKDLALFAGQSIFEAKAAVLKVTLRLENRQVWRRLVVPLNKTFNQLHQILQAAFGWQDYHLHNFYVYGQAVNSENYITEGHNEQVLKPIVNLVCDEEAFSYPGEVNMKLEKDVKLLEYIPASKKLTYNYDFGDDWNHDIEVESILENYDFNYPVCLEGEGNTPPEDVGGEYGYEQFLKILADPDHSEYEHMVNWGRMQRYQDFVINYINIGLKGL